MTGSREMPVVSIVGKSGSGKTTLVEKIIAELTARGYRVASVKHHVHEVEIDVPGKDSWRHAHAGAVTTMISSPTQFAVVRQVEHERTLEELAAEATGADILLTEGFKRAGSIRIEVSRDERSTGLISTADELFALVTDGVRDVSGVPVFALDDATAVTDLIERTFLRPDVHSGEEGDA